MIPPPRAAVRFRSGLLFMTGFMTTPRMSEKIFIFQYLEADSVSARRPVAGARRSRRQRLSHRPRIPDAGAASDRLGDSPPGQLTQLALYAITSFSVGAISLFSWLARILNGFSHFPDAVLGVPS